MHSILEAYRSGLISPKIPHPHLVYCGVKNEPTLHEYADKLASAGVPFCRFYEPDRGNELTAIATAPVYGDERRFFRNLSLIKE